MRSTPLAGGLALGLMLALRGIALAAPVPYTATVTVPEAEVRSGPSTDPKFYPTNRLRQGDPVTVLKERSDGWLEIRPPAGSFSWINTKFTSPIVPTLPNNFRVEAPAGEAVPVLIGEELASGTGRPTVIGARLERATQVHRWQTGGRPGAVLTDAYGTWMPIEPPDQEVRYLRAEAIAKPAAPPAPAAPHAAAPAAVIPPPAPTPVAAPGGTSFLPSATQLVAGQVPAGNAAPAAPKLTHAEVEEIYSKAVEADRAGNTQAAVPLYYKAVALGMTINSQVTPWALDRANFLMGYTRAVPTVPVADSRFHPMAVEPVTPPNVQLTRPYPPAPEQPAPATAATFTASRQVAAAPGAISGPSQFVGLLRRSGRGRGIAGKTYVLESDRGPLLYATPSAGVDLEAYVGKNVELTGVAGYDGEWRANYMTVTQVRLVQ